MGEFSLDGADCDGCCVVGALRRHVCGDTRSRVYADLARQLVYTFTHLAFNHHLCACGAGGISVLVAMRMELCTHVQYIHKRGSDGVTPLRALRGPTS